MLGACLSQLADELGLHIGVEAFDAAFVAVAEDHDAAERRFRQCDAEVIDRHHALVEFVGDLGGDPRVVG